MYLTLCILPQNSTEKTQSGRERDASLHKANMLCRRSHAQGEGGPQRHKAAKFHARSESKSDHYW